MFLRFVFCTALLIAAHSLFAQQTMPDDAHEKIKEIFKTALKTKNDSLVINLLDTSRTLSKEAYAYAHFCIAVIRDEKLDLEQKKQTLLEEDAKKRIKDIESHYQIAIDSTTTNLLAFRMDRLNFLEAHDQGPLYLEEKDKLSLMSSMNKKEGFGLGLQLSQGKNSWLGFELAFNALLETTKKQTNGSKDKPHSSQVFILGFNKNLNARVKEFTFSPFQSTAPIAINIFKTGISIDDRDTKSRFFYRPEIGLGWRFISLHYAYTAYFSKPVDYPREKHQLSLKLLMPINQKAK